MAQWGLHRGSCGRSHAGKENTQPSNQQVSDPPAHVVCEALNRGRGPLLLTKEQYASSEAAFVR
jgi:hypothetical protein